MGKPSRRSSTSCATASTNYVLPEDRIATFDQDGTLWVEHPIYTQVVYGVERVPALVATKPELKNIEPFKTVLSRNREAIAKLSTDDNLRILGATLTGMSVDQFKDEAKHWLDTAKHPRWKRPYTDLTYLPMIDVLKYLRANSYVVVGPLCAARFRHSPELHWLGMEMGRKSSVNRRFSANEADWLRA